MTEYVFYYIVKDVVTKRTKQLTFFDWMGDISDTFVYNGKTYEIIDYAIEKESLEDEGMGY